MADSLSEEVKRRAGDLCEYCRVPQIFDPLPFQIDHVIARQHDGPTSLENLALACLSCNNHKGPNIAGIDRQAGTQEVVRLFHPRNDTWNEHFEWNGPILQGTTAIGRVTVSVLGINLPHRIAFRRSLIDEGVFPT